MNYLHGLLFDAERTGELIGRTVVDLGVMPAAIDAIQRINAGLPPGATRDERRDAMRREGAAILRPVAGTPGVRELARGAGLEPDDLAGIGGFILAIFAQGFEQIKETMRN